MLDDKNALYSGLIPTDLNPVGNCGCCQVDSLRKGLSSDRRPVLDLLAVEGWRALLGILDGQVCASVIHSEILYSVRIILLLFLSYAPPPFWDESVGSRNPKQPIFFPVHVSHLVRMANWIRAFSPRRLSS